MSSFINSPQSTWPGTHRLLQTLSLLALLAGLSGPLAAQGQPYLRGGLSAVQSDDTTFRDQFCSNTTPPALFGCVLGNDGRALAARGDIDSSTGIETAIGYHVNRLLRLEGLLNYQRELDFSGQANFLGVSGSQPVQAEASALSAFAVLYADLPTLGRLQPYAGLGLGVSYLRLGPVRYGFPGLGATAATVSPAGNRLDNAWLLTAGAALPLGETLMLDLAYRHSDLGEMKTDSGPATIIRPSGTRTLNIDGTAAEVQNKSVVLSLRYHF